MAREDIYKMARALSRDTSPSSKRLPKYTPLLTEFIELYTAANNSIKYLPLFYLEFNLIKLSFYDLKA
jgi:hypothetical protein